MLIHYFGYVNPAYAELVRLARQYGAWVLEDEAHAVLTDLIGGRTGRLGDAAIMSLHKILPLPLGGALVRERAAGTIAEGALQRLWDFDLGAIATRRRANAREWSLALEHLQEYIQPLRCAPGDGEVPQSYPMLVRGLPRNSLYKC